MTRGQSLFSCNIIVYIYIINKNIMIHFIYSFIDIIGNNGPMFLFFITILVLQKQEIFLYAYLLFSFINIFLNRFLKVLIKQRRPYDHREHHELRGYEKYGMPSGHSQSGFFSLIFTWLATHSTKVFFIEFVICFIIIFQRLQSKYHTIEQLITGMVIGIFFAFFVYYLLDFLRYSQSFPDDSLQGYKVMERLT